MKHRHTLLLLISTFCFTLLTSAQEDKVVDSTSLKKTYGLRLGIDLSNPIRMILDSDRKAFEITADYRLTNNWYAAAEIGFLDKYSKEDYYNYTTNGQYIKLGANYNTYKNWLSMDNEIFIGARYGFSKFSQELHQYTIAPSLILPEFNETENTKFSSLNAHWIEFQVGMKSEVMTNLFLGFSLSLKKMISTKEPENFQNLTIPGFDRVYLNDVGFSFNYTVSYRIPLFNK